MLAATKLKLAMFARWSEATWEIRDETLANFLRMTGWRTAAEAIRARSHVKSDQKLRRAFSCFLSFANCEGHEKYIFTRRSDQWKAVSAVSF